MTATRLTDDELKELRRLHVQLGRRVDALLSGDYRSAMRGQGMEFEEVRAYAPGDDVRHIDWNVTARSGQPFIKVFREERQLTVMLVVDVSGSAHTGLGGRDGRTDRRLQLAGGLAFASLRNRDRIGLVTFSDRIEAFLPQRTTRAHVWSIIRTVFEASATSRGTSLSTALAHVHRVQRRRGTIVLLSDFLDDGAWDLPLAALSARHAVHAICVTDGLDRALPHMGLFEVRDSETGQVRRVDAAALTARTSIDARVDRIRRTGASPIIVDTQDDAIQALHRALHQRHRA